MINQFIGEYRWLSNFELCNLIYEGEIYISSEHAYQAAKSLQTGVRLMIANCTTPRLARKLGQQVECRPDWDEKKVSIMEDILRLKFKVGSPLAQKLLDTGDEELIEGNWWGDKFWGVCEGVGKNNLGKSLMKIRNELRWNNIL